MRKLKLSLNNYVILLSLSAIIIVYILSNFNLSTPYHEIYVRLFIVGFFILNVVALIVYEVVNLKPIQAVTSKLNILMFVSLSLLITSAIFKMLIGTYLSSLFVLTSLAFYYYNRNSIKITPVFYLLFVYAFMMILGTIGTQKGFRVPDKSLTLLLIPIAFSIINISYNTILRAMYLFFRLMMLYLVLSAIYWWFNFQYLDFGFIDWFSGKACFNIPELRVWNEQTLLSRGTTYAAYFFVTSWAYYFHPSYISLVLFFGLISGFYLYSKKDYSPTVNRKDLIVYIFFCFLIIALMQSRIGIVVFFMILSITSLYVLKLKNKNWKLFGLVYLAVFIFSVILFKHVYYNFIFDPTRIYYIKLAINYITNNFWWGAGYDQQLIALKNQAISISALMPYDGTDIFYTHNQFLGNMVQFGILGLVVLLLLLFSIFKYAIVSKSYLVQLFSMIILVFMFIEEPLYGQKGFTIFTIFFALFVKVTELEKQNKSELIFDK